MPPLEAMRALFAAWEAGDADALRDLFTDDGVYLDPLKPGPLTGVDEVVEGNRPAMAAIEDCRISVDLELEDARRAWPEKVLWTNFPGSELHRPDEEVVQYTVDLLETGMAGGRFLLTLTEDFPEPERTLPLIAEGVARYEAESVRRPD